MSRKIFLEMGIDWEDYEDISDDFLVIDAFENYQPKDGVTIKISTALSERDKLIDDLVRALKSVCSEKVRYCEDAGHYLDTSECKDCEGCDEPEEYLYGEINPDNKFNDLIARAEAMRGGK